MDEIVIIVLLHWVWLNGFWILSLTEAQRGCLDETLLRQSELTEKKKNADVF